MSILLICDQWHWPSVSPYTIFNLSLLIGTQLRTLVNNNKIQFITIWSHVPSCKYLNNTVYKTNHMVHVFWRDIVFVAKMGEVLNVKLELWQKSFGTPGVCGAALRLINDVASWNFSRMTNYERRKVRIVELRVLKTRVLITWAWSLRRMMRLMMPKMSHKTW